MIREGGRFPRLAGGWEEELLKPSGAGVLATKLPLGLGGEPELPVGGRPVPIAGSSERNPLGLGVAVADLEVGGPRDGPASAGNFGEVPFCREKETCKFNCV